MNMHIESGFGWPYFIRLCFCLLNQPFPLRPNAGCQQHLIFSNGMQSFITNYEVCK